MPIFEYKGLNSAGRKIKGVIDSDSVKSAKLKLKSENIYVTSIVEAAKEEEKEKKSFWDLSFEDIFSRITLQDIAFATRQLATLLVAGVPLIEALSALIEETEKVKLKKVLSQVRERVNEGSSLADALAPHKKIFSNLYINLVKAGESSGTLEIVLQRLADYLEDQLSLRNKVYGSLTYPVIMSVLMFGVVIFLFMFVIPKITLIFQEMRQALPIYTKILIASVTFMRNTWWIWVLFFILLFYLLKRYISTEKGRYRKDKLILNFPVVGNVFRMIAISRFSRTLSTLLDSGVSVVVAFDIVKNIVNNKVIEEAIEKAKENIIEGSSIADPLKESGVFPPIVVRMISVGERSGKLEEMLLKIADSYDEQVGTFLGALVSIIEPLVIVFLAGLVFLIMISILLPLFQMNQMIG